MQKTWSPKTATDFTDYTKSNQTAFPEREFELLPEYSMGKRA
jgi:hypothetical protein